MHFEFRFERCPHARSCSLRRMKPTRLDLRSSAVTSTGPRAFTRGWSDAIADAAGTGMLQRGRAHSRADGGVALAIVAVIAMLQRGRAHSRADGAESTAVVPLASLLQRGRAHSRADGCCARSIEPVRIELQRGRAHSRGYGRPVYRRGTRKHAASTGPRAFARGWGVGPGCRIVRGVASTGPRAFARGWSSISSPISRPAISFTGAARIRARMVITLFYEKFTIWDIASTGPRAFARGWLLSWEKVTQT